MEIPKLTDRIRASLTPLLNPGEPMRWAGTLSSGGTYEIFWSFPWFGFRIWWAGITDSRLIIVPQKRSTGGLIMRLTFSVPLENVAAKGKSRLTQRLSLIHI